MAAHTIMNGNTTNNGENNSLMDEDIKENTRSSELIQSMHVINADQNRQDTNDKGDVEDEKMLPSIRPKLPLNTCDMEADAPLLSIKQEVPFTTLSTDDNREEDKKEGDMIHAIETEEGVPSDNLPEPSSYNQNSVQHPSLSNEILPNNAQDDGEIAEKVVSPSLNVCTTQSNSTETSELVIIDAADGEDGGMPDKAPVDSAYREMQDESCDSSSDSEDSVILVREENDKCIVIESDDQEENKSKGKKDGDIRTKGEVYPEELPPLEELVITVDPNVELVHTGTITGIVGCLVIIKANQNIPPLNENTILFLEGRIVLGQIFEVFGPVGSPWYSLRFNSNKDIEKKSITCGQKVYCAPRVENLTNYVFVEHLRQMRGSDASWEDNNEPPEKYIDYSDDEEERRAKAKARNRGNETEEGHQLPGGRKVRRRRQRDKEPVQQNGPEESNSGVGSGTLTNPAQGNKREFYNNQSGRGRNFNQRGGRPQGQPRMEYQSFQPFGAPPRFPQTPETQNSPVGYQNNGPVRQPVFQPRYPDPGMSSNWNNHPQNQSNWNQISYPNTPPTQTTNYPYSTPNQTNAGGQYYPQFSGGFPNLSVPPPSHCFGQPPPVFNRQMMTDQRYIQNPAFQQNQGPQFDPNIPPPNFNV